MARKIKHTKSPEQRRAEVEALQQSIAEQVEQLRQSEQWTRFLAFAQTFHRYSLNNLLLILAQNPEATHVAGYRTWQSIGRQVRKGERGIRIFGGREVRRTVEEDAAEYVAYIVAGTLGLDTAAYSIGYVAGWSGCEAETIKATAANVLRAAHTLADVITEEEARTAA